MTPREIVIHCSDSRYGTPELLDLWHRSPPRSWEMLGYHYVITNGLLATSTEKRTAHYDGKIWPGRDEDMIGAHCYGHNSTSLGICLIGRKGFTDNQFDALEHLVKSLQFRYDIPMNNTYGHYELAAPPKEGEDPKTCPNFNMDWFRDVVRGKKVYTAKATPVPGVGDCDE